MTKQINELAVFQGGARLPGSAATGKTMVSDSSGNLAWQSAGLGPTTKATILVPGPIAVPSVDVNYIPPVFVDVPTGVSLSIYRARYIIHVGTSVTFKLQKNGVDITGFTGLSATTTAATTSPTPVAVADADLISVVVTAVSGSPQNMTVLLNFD